MYSIKDIAKEAGVSTSTVSRVISGKGYVSKEARNRVKMVIERVNYKPNSIARSLVNKKSKILGLLVPYIDSPFFASYVEGVETEAKKKGYDIFLCHTHENSEMEQKYSKLLLERRVDGIIATPVGRESSYYKELARQIPLVFVVRTYEDANISSVMVENISESYAIMKHLIEKGHRRIGVIKNSQEFITGRQRWIGVERAFHDYRITMDPLLITEAEQTVAGGYKAAMEMLQNPELPSAIYALNHLISGGVLKAIKEKGMNIPEDISLVAFDGFDDTYALDIIGSPGITANFHPSRHMGTEAVKLICEEISSKESKKSTGIMPRSVVLKMKFIDRGSVKDIKDDSELYARS